MSEIIKVENVTTGYGVQGKNSPIITDVSFSVLRGETLGLAGESGSGKTTIARAMLGLIPVWSGKIEKNVSKMQMVFQDPYGSLNPAKTVSWILQEPLRLENNKDKEMRLKEVDRIMDLVELDAELKERRPGELSGGQRQRVCLAAALMQNPDFLIADEPVSALDVTIQAQVLSLLKKIQKERNLTILFISHDLRTMYHFCDRIVVLRNGRVEEIGEPESMYRHPQTEYTGLLLKSAGIYRDSK